MLVALWSFLGAFTGVLAAMLAALSVARGKMGGGKAAPPATFPQRDVKLGGPKPDVIHNSTHGL